MILTPHRTEHSRDFAKKMKLLGKRVRKARVTADLTLHEVAQKVGCSFQRVSDIERGEAPSLATYLNLCKVLNGGKSLLGDC